MDNFYVYRHRCPITFDVRYVGKGRGKRAWCFSNRKAHHKHWISKLSNDNLRPIVELVLTNLSEDSALDAEMLLIGEYRELTNNLTNISNGGERGWTSSENRHAWNKGLFTTESPHFGKRRLIVTKQQQSKSAYKRSLREGCKGVSFDNRCPEKPWSARITISKGKRKYLGYYSTEKEANDAYLKELKNYV